MTNVIGFSVSSAPANLVASPPPPPPRRPPSPPPPDPAVAAAIQLVDGTQLPTGVSDFAYIALRNGLSTSLQSWLAGMVQSYSTSGTVYNTGNTDW